MNELLRDRLFLVWLVLVAVTLLSALIGGAHGFAGTGRGAVATFIVLGIAFAKVWLVMSTFMHVRGAPLALKILCGVWLLAVFTILLLVYVRILSF